MSEQKKSGAGAFLSNLAQGATNGILSGVFGTLTSVINNKFAEKQAERNFKYQQQENEQIFQQNRQLAQEQNAINIAQWERENAYNTPSAQMQRFMAAGLNPDLIYGQSNMSASSPTMVAGTPKDSANYAQSALAGLQQAAQIQNVFAQNKLLGAQQRNIEAQTRGQQIQNQFEQDTYDDRVFGVQLDNVLSDAQAMLTDEQRRLTFEQKYETRWKVRQLQQLVNNYDTVLDEVRSKTALMDEQAISEAFNRLLASDQYQLLEKKTMDELLNNKEWRLTQAQTRSYLRSQMGYLMSASLLNDSQRFTNNSLRPFQILESTSRVELNDSQKLINQKSGNLMHIQGNRYRWQNFFDGARIVLGFQQQGANTLMQFLN